MKSINERKGFRGKILLIFILVLTILLFSLSVSALRITNERFVTTSTTATITWSTDELSTSVVHYGLGNTNEIEEDVTLTRDHEIVLDNLQPNSIYDVRLESNTDTSSRTKVGLSFITKQRDVSGGSGTGTGNASGNGTIIIDTSIPTVDNLFNLPPAISADEITISGVVSANSRIKFYVNYDSISSQIKETGNFYVDA